MKPLNPLQECRSYVKAQFVARPTERHRESPPPPPLSVTLSRQAGARGHSISTSLVEELRRHQSPDQPPWTLFDRELVRQILDDHHLPHELAKFMPDDRVGELEAAINEILGRHPSSWTLFEYTVDTIVRLARLGHCIIVGRGAGVVTRSFPNTLHVRLIGSLEQRIRHMIQAHDMTERQAAAYIKSEDAARQKFLKQHFGKDINDPHLYDLILNTDFLEDRAAIQIIQAAIRSREPQPAPKPLPAHLASASRG